MMAAYESLAYAHRRTNHVDLVCECKVWVPKSFLALGAIHQGYYDVCECKGWVPKRLAVKPGHFLG